MVFNTKKEKKKLFHACQDFKEKPLLFKQRAKGLSEHILLDVYESKIELSGWNEKFLFGERRTLHSSKGTLSHLWNVVVGVL